MFLTVFRIHFDVDPVLRIYFRKEFQFFSSKFYVNLSRFFCYPDLDPRFLKWIRIRQNEVDQDPKHWFLHFKCLFKIFFFLIVFDVLRIGYSTYFFFFRILSCVFYKYENIKLLNYYYSCDPRIGYSLSI